MGIVNYIFASALIGLLGMIGYMKLTHDAEIREHEELFVQTTEMMQDAYIELDKERPKKLNNYIEGIMHEDYNISSTLNNLSIH